MEDDETFEVKFMTTYHLCHLSACGNHIEEMEVTKSELDEIVETELDWDIVTPKHPNKPENIKKPPKN